MNMLFLSEMVKSISPLLTAFIKLTALTEAQSPAFGCLLLIPPCYGFLSLPYLLTNAGISGRSSLLSFCG